jgi:PAS domain-containing protein
MSTSPLFSDETKLTFERQIFAILESISDGFILLNTHWCYTYVNRAAEAMLQKNRWCNGGVPVQVRDCEEGGKQ